MTVDQVHQLLDIITPCVLSALFVISLLIRLDQAKNKASLLAHQQEVKERLDLANSDLKTCINKIETGLATHVASTEVHFHSIYRTLSKLENHK